MTTATLASPRLSVPTRAVGPVTFPRVLSSEWVKLRTVRSTVWTLSATVLVMIGVAVLSAWGMSLLLAEEPADLGTDPTALLTHPAAYATNGVFFAQLVVLVLGVLTISGEYGTGMIRSTFAAVPSRVPALLGKAVVLFSTVFAVSTLAVALSFAASLPFLGELGGPVDFSSGETWRILLGAPLYLATMSLLALGVGALVRHSAGGIAIVIGLVLVVEQVLGVIPVRVFELVSPFLPASAGSQLLLDENMLAFSAPMAGDVPVLTPWQGYGVLAAWVLVVLGAAAVLLRRRDA